ncbi:beta-ketoacyl synthase N-terminal-like domain-containing protein [Spongiactinospora sp. TRM90649]|uniref:beta-ketoacyl synthase N-terminal-like domain-containing protein n=1 Tax=Spongiactinospora sp. TRM90649 TaxID=3031114 RepID=UPI0023F99C51|nr:beta-ketoacyl synthase N-terminal-like domain-containing protein [Spongiactinospora sp. TRM90649]MDF5755380.1 beta-ketoacyl synthase N-terminal-like domain-containing protein [Spongiactinospora sp. TRM90649]
MPQRAVISGIGVIAPTGVGAADHWFAGLAGRSGIRELPGRTAPGLKVRVAGQVAGFDETEFVANRLLVQTDRWSWLGLAATELALSDAALDTKKEFPFHLSVVTAAASGGNAFGQREIQALYKEGPRSVSAYQSIGWFYAASSGQISIRHQLKGACGVLVADAAGGIDALAQSRRLISRGSGVVVTGGTEAPLSPYAMACQASQETLSPDPDPATAYRPFAPDATGQVPGEGGAMLVVEEWRRAHLRGATVYAEVAGSASTHDATDATAPASDHAQYARAMREAIGRSGCEPGDIDAVFADGAGDPLGDELEARALREVFGPRRVPVTVPKTMTGRLCSGGAALDLAWAALSVSHGVLPPTINVDTRQAAARHGIDLVAEPRELPGTATVLVAARGAGGFNSAAVLRTPAYDV